MHTPCPGENKGCGAATKLPWCWRTAPGGEGAGRGHVSRGVAASPGAAGWRMLGWGTTHSWEAAAGTQPSAMVSIQKVLISDCC